MRDKTFLINDQLRQKWMDVHEEYRVEKETKILEQTTASFVKRIKT